MWLYSLRMQPHHYDRGYMKRGREGRILRRLLALGVFTAFVAGIVVLAISAATGRTQELRQKEAAEEKTKQDFLQNGDYLLSAAGMGEKEPDPVQTTKEIIADTVISAVPHADYSYSFNGTMDQAVVVARDGDVGGFNDGTYPRQDDTLSSCFTEGVEGSALYLDGSYGVELLGVQELADSYTISFWFRAEELCDWSPFLAIGSDMLNEEGAENYISFNKKTDEDGNTVAPVFNTVNQKRNNSCEIRPSLEDKDCLGLNEWNYITVCVDASQVNEEDDSKITGYLYLNSEMIGSAAVSRMDLTGGDIHVYLGINCFDELFAASYDEVRIWNELLSENQISSMYAAYCK